MRIELDEFLEAQPVLDLELGLGVTQTIEMLQDHHPQQDRRTIGWATTGGISVCHLLFSLRKINFAGNDFQHLVGRTPLLHGQFKKGGLILAFSLHAFLTNIRRLPFKYFCRDFQRDNDRAELWIGVESQMRDVDLFS